MQCQHQPPCPSAEAPDREAAHTVAYHPEQGWSLLCNGVVTFDDSGHSPCWEEPEKFNAELGRFVDAMAAADVRRARPGAG